MAFRRRASEIDTRLNPEARKEKASLLRRAQRLEEDFDEQYQRELKRTGVDPVRQPGWAKVIADRVDRSMTTVERVEDRAAARRENEDESLRRRRAQAREQERRNRHEEIDDEFNLLRAVEDEKGVPNPAVMAAIERERKLAKARADAIIAKQEGKGLPGGPGTMRQQQARVVASPRALVAVKHEAGKRAPVLAPMRQRTAAEDDAWLERVERIAPTEGPQRVYATSKRWHTDAKYRKAQEADARKLYAKTQRRVEVVNEQGKPLFIYPIGAGTYRGLAKAGKLGALKDAESERLIHAVITDAERANCRKAVRNLFRVQPLVSDTRTERLFDRAVTAVEAKCGQQIDEEIEEREEILEESFGPNARSLTQARARLTAEMLRAGIAVLRAKEARKHIFGQKVRDDDKEGTAYEIRDDYAKNIRAIREAIRRKSISEADAEALLIIARDYERAIRDANIYVPSRASAGRRFTYTKRRKGMPAEEVTEPARGEAGFKRRRYIR